MNNYYSLLLKPKFERHSRFLNAFEGLKYGNIEPSTYIPYKHYESKSLNPKTEEEARMYDLMAIWFMINEMNIYLDTHPDDEEALHLLNDSIQKYDDLKVEFSMKYYPLCLTIGDFTKKPFKWTCKWPWEGDVK